MPSAVLSPASFETFGNLLKYLRRRARLTQLELSMAVGYSEAQISRLEQGQRLPELAALKALFIPALGLESEPEWTERLLALAQSARQEDEPARGISPYKGLLYFNEDDSSIFFGREALTTHLAKRVSSLAKSEGTRFLAIVGASGSGKSSLARAGLAAALKRAGWLPCIFTPTSHPLRALESALNRLPQRKTKPILIIVDQFEEVFTLCRDEAERAAFIESLLVEAESGGAAAVVIALRSDFYPHCAQYPKLRKVLAAQQEYIGQMTDAELRRAIEEPAKRGGWELEPGLADVMLRDVGADGTIQPEPGALPLLSHALFATWERRRGRRLTLAGYRDSGGMRGAIAQTAESVFTDRLNRAEQEFARDIFLRLTELRHGAEDTRRRADLKELIHRSEEAAQLRGVLNTLAEARLITLSKDSAEVAHEALIREWQRLRQWLTQNREGLRIHRHLTESAQEWEQLGRDPGELYRGARLAQAREWAEGHWNDLNDLEREFLNASVQCSEREAAEQKERLERELDTARKLAETEARRAEEQSLSALRLKKRAAALAGTLIVAIVLAAAAFWFGRQAWANSNVAASRELAAASVSNLEVDPERSILLALYALDKADTPQARDALYQAVQKSRVVAALHGGDAAFIQAVFSADGKNLVTVNADGSVQTWDAETAKEVSSFDLPAKAPSADIFNLAVSADGSRVAQAADSTVSVFDAKSGKRIASFQVKGELGVSLSRDGSRLAVGTMDGVVAVYELDGNSDALMVYEGDGNPLGNPFFSPDGSQIGAISLASLDKIENAKVIVWDAASGKQINAAPGYRAALGPNGRLVTVLANNELAVWDVETGLKLHTLTGHTNAIYAIAFSPNGNSIASAGWDRAARIWDAETGRLQITLNGHSEGVLSVAFGPDGNSLLTTSQDKTARLWDLAPRQGVIVIYTPDSAARVTFSPDGKWAAMGLRGAPGRVLFWDAASGEELLDFETHHASGVNAVAFSPDQTRFATASHDKTVAVWALSASEDNRPQLELLYTLNAQEVVNGVESIYGVAFSPDGRLLGTASDDGSVRIWDAASGKEVYRLKHPGGSPHIVFNADGSRFATAGYDGTTRIWDTAAGEIIWTLKGHNQSVWGAAFSPDGKWFATASRDGTAKLWDAKTGEEVRVFSGHSGTVVSVAFSPDSLQLATASRDGTAKLWNISTGQQILTFASGSAVGLNSAVFSPDGSRLAAAGNNEVRIYSLLLEDLISLARSRLTRELTPEECFQYLHQDACPSD